MADIIGILKDQGLRVGNGRDSNNHPVYYITDEEGFTYIVSYAELDDLRGKGKLSLEGIEEHDELVRKAKNV